MEIALIPIQVLHLSQYTSNLQCSSKMSPNWPYLRSVEGSIEAGWFCVHGRAATFFLIRNSLKSSEIMSVSQNCVQRLDSTNHCATDFWRPIKIGFNMVLKEDSSKSAHFEPAVIFLEFSKIYCSKQLQMTASGREFGAFDATNRLNLPYISVESICLISIGMLRAWILPTFIISSANICTMFIFVMTLRKPFVRGYKCIEALLKSI